MTPEEKKQRALDFIFRSAANDRVAVEAIISDDFRCEMMEVDAAWQLGDKTMDGTLNRAEYLDFGMPSMQQLFRDGIQFTSELEICEGPHVVILGRSEAVANNGNRYHNVYSWYFRFAGDDRIELLREYRDTAHSRAAIGF